MRSPNYPPVSPVDEGRYETIKRNLQGQKRAYELRAEGFKVEQAYHKSNEEMHKADAARYKSIAARHKAEGERINQQTAYRGIQIARLDGQILEEKITQKGIALEGERDNTRHLRTARTLNDRQWQLKLERQRINLSLDESEVAELRQELRLAGRVF